MKKRKKTYENLDLNTCKLKEIDQVLEDMTHADQHNQWSRYFRLFDTIRARELFREGGFSSFTAWLSSFCANNSISEQRAWAYKRAGEVYEKYRKTDPLAPELEDITIAPETLVNIDKSAHKRFGGKKEGEKARQRFIEKYVDRAIKGKLTRDSSKQLYRDARKASERAKIAQGEGKTEREAGEIRRNTEKSDEIKRELQENWHWLGEKQEVKTNYRHSSSVKDFYVALPEFVFSTPGENRSEIVADILILENIRPKIKGYDLSLHAVEIKVDPYDFERDNKWIDYRDHADFLWLCAPERVLLDLKPDQIPSVAGVIAYREDSEAFGIVVEQGGEFARESFASVKKNNLNQIKFGSVPGDITSNKLYIVRQAEKNMNEEKKTEQTLRWWALRRR